MAQKVAPWMHHSNEYAGRMASEQPTHIPKFIRRVMPTASDAELYDATECFKQYVAVVMRIYDRTKRERAVSDSQDSESHGRIANDPIV